MVISTRDYADKIGAIIGTVSGIGLASYFFSKEKISELVIHGHSYGNRPIIRNIGLLLTIGLCANLGRNGAVGIHDTIVYSKIGTEMLYNNINNCFKKHAYTDYEDIEKSKNQENNKDNNRKA